MMTIRIEGSGGRILATWLQTGNWVQGLHHQLARSVMVCSVFDVLVRAFPENLDLYRVKMTE
jgi:hypothetical protein